MARKMLIDGELSKPNEEETHYDFDLFVIGAGSGGVRAARFSANFGAKVSFWRIIKKIMVLAVIFEIQINYQKIIMLLFNRIYLPF